MWHKERTDPDKFKVKFVSESNKCVEYADGVSISFNKWKAEASDSWAHRRPGLFSRGCTSCPRDSSQGFTGCCWDTAHAALVSSLQTCQETQPLVLASWVAVLLWDKQWLYLVTPGNQATGKDPFFLLAATEHVTEMGSWDHGPGSASFYQPHVLFQFEGPLYFFLVSFFHFWYLFFFGTLYILFINFKLKLRTK